MYKVNDYFRDPVYMLELNLQRIRRELIQLLDESEENECFICNRLKCCCVDNSSVKSSTLSILTPVPSSKNSVNSVEEPAPNPIAPPAEALPRPEWQNSGVAAWVRASTSTPNPDPNNEVSHADDSHTDQAKPSTSQNLKDNSNASQAAQNIPTTSHVVARNPTTSQVVQNNTNTGIVNSPNVSLEISVKVAKANASLQPEASKMNQNIRILSKSTPNISHKPPTVQQKPKAPSQDGKEADGKGDGKVWHRTIWNEWNQLDDGVRWPGVEQQQPDSVEAFFRSFNEVAGNSSAVGYSYF